MQNHHQLKMDKLTGFDPISLLWSGGFFILGIIHTFQDLITVAVGVSALLYNVFKFLKENFPNTYKRAMKIFRK